MGTGRGKAGLVHQCETDWKIRLAAGQGKGVRVRQGRRLELDEGSPEGLWWAERRFTRRALQ